MKKFMRPSRLPLLSLVCGAGALGLHQLLYVAALDEKNLLTAGHPVEITLWLLTAALAAMTVCAVRPLKGGGDYAANFPRSITAAAGGLAFGVCIVLTVLLQPAPMAGALGEIWRWLGLLAFLMLAWAGSRRLEGRTPSFVTHLALCTFLAAHLISHYRTWSGNPELQDYVFTLLGFVALLFYTYYHTAFDVGFNRRRLMLAAGLLSMYLLTVGMLDTPYWLLHLGGIIWVWSNFCVWDGPKESVA